MFDLLVSFVVGAVVVLLGYKFYSWVKGECCPEECCSDDKDCCAHKVEEAPPAPPVMEEPIKPKRVYKKRAKKSAAPKE